MQDNNWSNEYEAEIFDLKGNHLASIYTASQEIEEPYRVGGEVYLSDTTLYQNNSKTN